MKLMIFRTHNLWKYGSGAYVCVAKDLEDAKRLADSEYGGLDCECLDSDVAMTDSNYYCKWVLEEDFPTDEKESRIILLDYSDE